MHTLQRFTEDVSHVLNSLALRREQALALPQLFTHEHPSNTCRQLAVMREYRHASVPRANRPSLSGTEYD